MAQSVRESPVDVKPFENRDEILLGVLSAVDRDAQISQRKVSRELGVALGLANAYLKRCVRKGLIKIKQAPRRRYAYYLTPLGFSEKARLTGQYLSASFNFFRAARGQMSELMGLCVARGWRRIALAGMSDLAEVGTLCAREHPIELVAIIDPAQAGGRYGDLPIIASLAEGEPVDAVIVTSLAAPQDVYKSITREIGVERVLAPRLLRLGELADAAARVTKEAAE